MDKNNAGFIITRAFPGLPGSFVVLPEALALIMATQRRNSSIVCQNWSV